MPLRGIALFALLLGSLPVCFIKPFYGLLVWLVIAFLNPQSALFYWTAAISFPWALAVAVPTLVGFVLFSRGWFRRIWSPQTVLIAVCFAWFSVTSIVSTGTPLFVHHAADTWNRWEFVSKVLVMTLAMVAIVNSFSKLRVMVLIIASCFGFFVLKCFPFILMTGGAFRLYGPPNSMIADNNDFGLALNMTLPIFFYLANTESRPWAKNVFAFLFVITIPAIFFTYSRGALVGLLTGLTVLLLRSKRRLILLPVIVLGCAVALLFAPSAWKQRMDPTRSDAVDASARSRLNAWSYSWHLAMDYPIAGGGFATFTPELFARYAPTATDIHGPHSVYFQVLAEHGFVGFFLYLGLLISCFNTTRRVARAARRWKDVEVFNYAMMFQSSLIGFLTPGFFLGRAYFDYFFTIVGAIVILDKCSRDDWSRYEETASSAEEQPELQDSIAPLPLCEVTT